MKRNKKFHTWKNKWKRKQKFNWKKIGVHDKFYRETKWCGDSIHKERRHQDKMAIKKLMSGETDALFTTKKPYPNKSNFYYW